MVTHAQSPTTIFNINIGSFHTLDCQRHIFSVVHFWVGQRFAGNQRLVAGQRFAVCHIWHPGQGLVKIKSLPRVCQGVCDHPIFKIIPLLGKGLFWTVLSIDKQPCTQPGAFVILHSACLPLNFPLSTIFYQLEHNKLPCQGYATVNPCQFLKTNYTHSFLTQENGNIVLILLVHLELYKFKRRDLLKMP